MPAEIINFPGSQPERNESLNYNILTEMLVFLTKQSYNHPETTHIDNVNVRQDLLSNTTSNKDLISMVNNSTEEDWRHKPALYRAIISELERRQIIKSPNSES